ncbi:MFS transporter [Microtetraspora malaysiensis]|uniref:MFS transporter n=1 Tax=Microtetraspora malaysiensis TaxID=161358 RepID=UPI000835529E|nr:MFS transporter [Microtetraspora malaysiensis]
MHSVKSRDQSARWSRILPVVFVTYSLAFLDRGNYSLGAAGGLSEELGITASISGLIAASFFLGYFLFQIPAAHYAERRSAVNLVFWTLIAWGLLSSVQGLISSVPMLILARFFLGVAEAAVFPALVILLTRWFRRDERGRANTFLILGSPVTVMWMSAVTGYLIEATSWRWMFIAEGVPAILFAFVFKWLVNDSPRQAAWLDAGDCARLESDLESEQRDLPRFDGYLQAFRSRQVVLLSLQYAFWTVGVYGLLFWMPTIIKAASKQGIGNTGLLTALPYVVAVVCMIANSYWSDRSQAPRSRFVWPFLLASALLFYASSTVSTDNFLLGYVLLCLAVAVVYAPYGPYFAAISELLPRNVAGAATALVNSLGALGSFAGTYLVGWLTGDYGAHTAFLFLAVSLACSSLIMLLVRKPDADPAVPLPVGQAAQS